MEDFIWLTVAEKNVEDSGFVVGLRKSDIDFVQELTDSDRKACGIPTAQTLLGNDRGSLGRNHYYVQENILEVRRKIRPDNPGDYFIQRKGD